jgi:hypothetical protein
MKKYVQSNIVTMLMLFLASALLSVVIYPEVFVYFKTSFVLWQDYCVEYPLTFVLTNFFYQGGLQLWDFFGQMPLTYVYATFGLFKLPNLISAIAYYLCHPFVHNSSQLFHHVFTLANLGTLLFIRVAGIFLLLQAVTKKKYILCLGTVIFSVFFCQLALMRGTFLMSYFPLGMYFIVRYFQVLQWRYLAATIFFLAVVMGSSVVHGACMYLPIHFFIISGILWRVFICKKNFSFNWHAINWKNAVLLLSAVVLIILPYAYIVHYCLHDTAFGMEDSRINHIFSPSGYFHRLVLDLGNPQSFFSDDLNYLTYAYYYVYSGWMLFFLAVAGIILSRNTLKWFFALGILFLWLLSFPREGMNIGLIAHWVNVLTNPLKTIPRSYVACNQGMLPFLLMPLAVMGIEAIGEIYAGNKFSSTRIRILCVVMVLGGACVFPALPSAVRLYLTICTIVVVISFGWVQLHQSFTARRCCAGLLCLLVISDIALIIHQSKTIFAHVNRTPVVLDAAPQSGMVGYDDENPSIFPYRYSYLVHFSYSDEMSIWFPHGISSDFHHVVNQGLNFVYLNGHNPRHAAFAQWPGDGQMLHYLMNDQKFIFLADEAINASGDALTRITDAGLARQVAMVDDPTHVLNLGDQWSNNNVNKGAEDILFNTMSGELINKGPTHSSYDQQGDLILVSMTLPDDFPKFLASSWFAQEQRYLHFLVEGNDHPLHEFQPVQGELIRPYTFDVQNIKKGMLIAAFPKDDFKAQRKFVLYYPSGHNNGVTGLWQKQFDNLGIVYNAPRNGWLVCHYPYDTKFRINVDGNDVRYYRTNKSFIGFPLSQGKHRILIQYWPHSPLRILLLISAVLTTLGLPILILLGLTWEQEQDKINLCSKI